jgi:hypothetical protein
MSEISLQNLSDVAETLLMMLYIRAVESQRPDGLIKDEKAMALVQRMDQDFLRNKLTKIDEETRVAIILRSREFDRHAWDFLARHPEAAVVHIGCGLDARFERVDNGRVEWYDLDLPDVIELRRKLIGGEGARHHFLACSVLDSAWLNEMSAHRQPPGRQDGLRPARSAAEGGWLRRRPGLRGDRQRVAGAAPGRRVGEVSRRRLRRFAVEGRRPHGRGVDEGQRGAARGGLPDRRQVEHGRARDRRRGLEGETVTCPKVGAARVSTSEAPAPGQKKPGREVLPSAPVTHVPRLEQRARPL